jgi:cation:H+ antiporter
MLSIGLAILAFIVGIIFLYKCSDILVEGTSKTAAQLGISSLIISVIVVAFGTSAPEFAISVGAAFQSHADISMGNIVGSCIANLLLVLGVSAIIRPIKVKKTIIRREMPIIIGVTIVLLLSSFFGLLDTHRLIGGAIFLVLFAVFIVYFIRCAKKERNNDVEKYKSGKTLKNIIFIISGIVGVVVGALLLIESALSIADFFGIPEMIVALSMVAVGTSIPELVVSAMAAYKNESDIAVGNVIGSNVFNIFLILGASALLIPLNAVNSIGNLLILMAVTLVMFPVLYTGHVISRKEGVFLLVLYLFFICYIFLA